MDDAAAAAGVSSETVRSWMRKGGREKSSKDQEYAEFLGSLLQAEGEVATTARIAQAGAKVDWRADAWRLECRDPKKWSPKVELADES